eukprot:UC4_evm2s1406
MSESLSSSPSDKDSDITGESLVTSDPQFPNSKSVHKSDEQLQSLYPDSSIDELAAARSEQPHLVSENAAYNGPRADQSTEARGNYHRPPSSSIVSNRSVSKVGNHHLSMEDRNPQAPPSATTATGFLSGLASNILVSIAGEEAAESIQRSAANAAASIAAQTTPYTESASEIVADVGCRAVIAGEKTIRNAAKGAQTIAHSISKVEISQAGDIAAGVIESARDTIGDVIASASVSAGLQFGQDDTEMGAIPIPQNVYLCSSSEIDLDAMAAVTRRYFGANIKIDRIRYRSGVVAEQPIGFKAGKAGAEGRIAAAQDKLTSVPDLSIMVSAEGFLYEAFPGKWFLSSYLVLKDFSRNISLDSVSQSIHVPQEVTKKLQDACPEDYKFVETGLSKSVDTTFIGNGESNISDPHRHLCGVSKRNCIDMAASVLIGEYRKVLTQHIYPLASNSRETVTEAPRPILD